MKVLFIHAHFDDYEFTAAGSFELWRRALGQRLTVKVIIVTDGQAGHHFRTREETAAIRLREQLLSSQIGEYEFEQLRYPNGVVPREACLQISVPLLAALWKAIRDFEPDYLFCPPLPADPLVGIHNDHVTVAEAIRRVAYMINVPHAFTPEYPADERLSVPCKVPVILHVFDGYMSGGNSFDLAAEISPAFDAVAQMTWCHESQITEWLPWVGRHQMAAPDTYEAWREILRQRCLRQQRGLGLPAEGLFEVFTVSAWGEIPRLEQLLADFPWLDRAHSRLDPLAERLTRWHGT